jgi:adenylosuccinate synthase
MVQAISANILFAARLEGAEQKAQRPVNVFCLKGRRALALDIDFGTYPFVTSSMIAGQAATGVGVGPGTVISCWALSKRLHDAGGRRTRSRQTHDMTARCWAERGHELAPRRGAKRRWLV